MNELCEQLHKMEPPTTPPRRTPRLNRARTPPSPRHGALFDDYEPYSPRRSTRSTLNSNPYSSVNKTAGGDSSAEIHDTPAKKPRFAIENLLSPPSSPASARRSKLNLNATPRRADNTIHDNTNKNHLDPSSSTRGVSGMLSTPSKTPTTTPARKHQRASSMQDTARVLHFQPGDPNDVMPSRKDKRKQKPARAAAAQDFGLDGDDFSETASQRSGSFQIYAEAHARVPQLDTSEENPFYRPRANTIPATRSSPRRVTRKTQAQILEDQRMEEAVEREEGMVFMFRGKKVFRKFQDTETGDSNLEQSDRQRALKRSVGTAAERPITRSNIQPRLLFGTFDSGYSGSDDVDEEAETDLDVSDAPTIEEARPTSVPIKVASTPARSKPGPHRIMTPPTTARTTRKRDAEEAVDKRSTPGPTPTRTNKKKKVAIDTIPIYRDCTPEEEHEAAAIPPTPQGSTRKKPVERDLTPIIEDDADSALASSQESSTSATRRKTRSPFDDWPRTKSAHKREGDPLESASSKRTRGATAMATP